jgi:hypothetical protein
MTAKQKQEKPAPTLAQDITWTTEEAARYAAPVTTALFPNGADNTKKNLAAALAAAQAECQNVTMNKVNPHFRSKYADLSAVRDAIIPVFNKHGISVIQAPTTDGFSGFSLETRLMHSSGEYLIFNFPLPSDTNKMQAIGSAISYARRYTLSAIAGIASEEDDDGNAATNTNGGGRSFSGAGKSGQGSSGATESRGYSGGENGGITL